MSSHGAVTAPASVARSVSNRLRTLYRHREASLLVALLLIVLIFTLLNSVFIRPDNIQDILLNSAVLAIFAVGQTVVLITRNIDLSVGAILGLSAYIATDFLRDNPQVPLLFVFAIGAVVGLILGTVNGLLVAVAGLPSVVATLGTLYVFRGIDAVLAGNLNEVTAYQLPDSFLSFGELKILGISVLAWIAAVVVVVLTYILRNTAFGRQLYAIGSNPAAARLAAIPVNARVCQAFAINGLLCGVGGTLWAAQYVGVNSTTGTGFEFVVIAAVVVGGVNIFGGSGTAIGAALGAVLLMSIQSGLTLLMVSPFWLGAIYGAAILLAITVDGLVNKRFERVIAMRRR